MASYYYLISSLPEEMPITYDEFIAMCEDNVSDKTLERLKNLTLDSTEGPLLKKWSGFYTGLFRELNAQRSAALGKSYQAEYEKNPESTQIAQAAITAKNPLEAEKLLLVRQFEALDYYTGGHFFDDVCLFGYAIKLKLLERQSCFVKEKGEAVSSIMYNIAFITYNRRYANGNSNRLCDWH